ncbi:MAG TPA: hypothetical protein VGC54_01635 [Planctomycetota bacterium]
MSPAKSKNQPQQSATPAPAASASTMSSRRKWALIVLVIFMLLIFSVTGPMFDAIGSVITGGPAVLATAEIPGRGKVEIRSDEYYAASRLLAWENRLRGSQAEVDDDDILAYATLMELANELELQVPKRSVVGQIQGMMSAYQIGEYSEFYRRFGFRNAIEFEGQLAALMRIDMVRTLLAGSIAPTTADALRVWSERYEEFALDYVVFRPDEFVEAAAVLVPEEEALRTFYDEGLGMVERAELEQEEAVAFEALVLTGDALGTEAAKAWADAAEPTEQELDGHYTFNRFRYYLRDEPAEGQDPTLSKEELGARLAQDFVLNRAAERLATLWAADADVAAFAAEKGVEHLVFSEPIPASQLADLERVGQPDLRRLLRQAPGAWLNGALLGDDLAFLVRPIRIQERALPPFEDLQVELTDLWRKGQQRVLAEEATKAFRDGLPRPEDAVEGDPVQLDAAAFADAVRAADRGSGNLAWISRVPRAVTDPRWPVDDRLSPWLRSRVGGMLDDLVENEILAPLESTQPGVWVVARLAGKRPADVTKIWPGEVDTARSLAFSQAAQEFYESGVGFEGLSRAFDIRKQLNEEN